MALRRFRGVTLIELLVVVAIIAVLYGAIVLAVGAVGGGRVVEREARRFEALVAVACERAQLSGRDYGVHAASDSYAFSLARADGWKIERDGDLRPRRLPEGLSLKMSREGSAMELGDEVSDEPQAACFASGELTPFTAVVAAGEAVPPFTIEAELDGTLMARAAPVAWP